MYNRFTIKGFVRCIQSIVLLFSLFATQLAFAYNKDGVPDIPNSVNNLRSKKPINAFGRNQVSEEEENEYEMNNYGKRIERQDYPDVNLEEYNDGYSDNYYSPYEQEYQRELARQRILDSKMQNGDAGAVNPYFMNRSNLAPTMQPQMQPQGMPPPQQQQQPQQFPQGMQQRAPMNSAPPGPSSGGSPFSGLRQVASGPFMNVFIGSVKPTATVTDYEQTAYDTGKSVNFIAKPTYTKQYEIGLGFGTDYPQGVRWDAGLSYVRLLVQSGSATNSALMMQERQGSSFAVREEFFNATAYKAMFNVYYDILKNSIAYPYIGFGLGETFLDFQDRNIRSNFAPTYGFRVGINFKISGSYTAYLEYAVDKINHNFLKNEPIVDNNNLLASARETSFNIRKYNFDTKRIILGLRF